MNRIWSIWWQADWLIKLAHAQWIGLPANYSWVPPEEKQRVLEEFRPVFDAILKKQEEIK